MVELPRLQHYKGRLGKGCLRESDLGLRSPKEWNLQSAVVYATALFEALFRGSFWGDGGSHERAHLLGKTVEIGRRNRNKAKTETRGEMSHPPNLNNPQKTSRLEHVTKLPKPPKP